MWRGGSCRIGIEMGAVVMRGAMLQEVVAMARLMGTDSRIEEESSVRAMRIAVVGERQPLLQPAVRLPIDVFDVFPSRGAMVAC